MIADFESIEIDIPATLAWLEEVAQTLGEP